MKGVNLVLILVSFCVSSGSSQNLTRAVDEDALLTVPKLIQKYGYPVEVHHVTTEDGYILEMHRIPHGVAEEAGPKENKPVVFIQHGLLCSSADWIIPGPKKGLAYLLADLGYDVWMGNARGNRYSKKHESLDPKDSQFWDFSWHEIGIHDLPAMVDYVIKTTNEPKMFYIGHSQGTTAFYVMCSMKPEYNSKFRAMFSLAPIAYMYHLFSPPMRFIAKLSGFLELLSRLFGDKEFLPSTKLLAYLGDVLCKESSVTQLLCTNSLFVFCGFSIKQMNTELLPVIMGHTPAGSSTKQFLHYGQNINHKDKFRQWDYGRKENKIKYNSTEPPSYDISKITTPVALFYTKNDWLAAEVDVMKLYEELPNPMKAVLVTDKYFNHLDFLWGKDVDTLVYNEVFSLMSGFLER